jgi:hypothetical protein
MSQSTSVAKFPDASGGLRDRDPYFLHVKGEGPCDTAVVSAWETDLAQRPVPLLCESNLCT